MRTYDLLARAGSAGPVTRAVRLLVVDRYPVVYAGICHISASCAWLHVVGYARTGQAAIAAAKATGPRIVLLGLRLPDMSAADVIGGLRGAAADVRVVTFVTVTDLGAVTVGADGMVRKDADTADLLEILHRVDSGDHVPDRQLQAGQPPGVLKEYGITRREYQILRRVAAGETNAEAARALGLANSTVKTYLQRTLEKLGARNRTEAVVRAGEIGLL